MGSVPTSSFDPLRVLLARAGIPFWKVRLGVGAAVILGVLVLLLLLPLVLLLVLVAAAWIGAMRVQLWVAGLRGRIAPDSAGRENVRVLPHDA